MAILFCEGAGVKEVYQALSFVNSDEICGGLAVWNLGVLKSWSMIRFKWRWSLGRGKEARGIVLCIDDGIKFI